MLIGFFAASTSIAIGFVVSFSLFYNQLEHHAWKTFAALAGSWMGGTGNMAAIQGALNVPDSNMGYTLLIDSIDYAIWVVLLLALVPLAPLFNKWSRADTRLLDEIGGKLGQETSIDRPINATDLLFLTGLSLLAAAYSPVLVPIGVLMAMLGYIVGTAGGLLVGRVLSLIAS